ncbi:MAG: hypothetical protein ACP5U1_09000 [Desulfomonilaceae bacterium]
MTSRVKLCGVCGGVMRRSSRRVLSGPAGVVLIFLGLLLMAGYGFFTNFYQAPWLVRFALPSLYYIGSIFIGLGFIFFFIRENIWRCVDCGEITKR